MIIITEELQQMKKYLKPLWYVIKTTGNFDKSMRDDVLFRSAFAFNLLAVADIYLKCRDCFSDEDQYKLSDLVYYRNSYLTMVDEIEPLISYKEIILILQELLWTPGDDMEIF